MSPYLNHLNEMSDENTLERKLEYLQHNVSEYIEEFGNQKIKVLEIGPGAGELECFLNRRDITDIDIIDNDKSVLDFVGKKYKVKNKFLAKNIKSINNKLKNYDLIFLIQVLEHIPVDEFKGMIKVLESHLNKDGYLVIVVPNGNSPLGMTERYADLQHTTSFTTQSLKDLTSLTGTGNYQVEIKGYEIPPSNLVNIIRKVLQKILHTLLLLIMIINGGLFYKIMAPNIMLVIKKTKKDAIS